MAQRVAPGAVVRGIAARAVRQPNLVTLVHERHSGEREQQQRRGAHVLLADPGGQPFEVVVREHPGDPAELRRRPDRGAQRTLLPGREEQLEREDEVELLEVARVVGGSEVDLADEQGVTGGLAQCRQRLYDLRPAG